MTARLAVTRAQARVMADVASEKGCVVEVEREGTIYRVIPEKSGGVRRMSDLMHPPAPKHFPPSDEQWQCIRSEIANGCVIEQWANVRDPDLQFGFMLTLDQISLAAFTDPVGVYRRDVFMERHDIRGTLLNPPSYTRLQLSVVASEPEAEKSDA